MATILQNQTGQIDEQVYSDRESIGVAALVACGMLSLICVLGMFVILGVSVVRSRRSSDKTLFVRTHIAIYFLSLLICNLAQAIGGVLNIAWVIENRVYVGVACTTQATIKQTGNVGTAIFSFVIAAHTFSLLFLRHQWSDRTCYVILGVSWASLLLEMCIENFILAEPTKIGPYYGVAGYWCWITSMYTVARYATSYLLMFISAALSFILYLLVFFRLRGNISVSAGYKIYVHRSPKLRVGRTSDGTYIITDDRRVESHLTRVAKHMLWYPLAYTVLVLPMAASRFSAFSGASVPFSVTIVTASVFMLHGCVNTLLFCTTRNILPGSWRQRFGLGTTWDGGRGDLNQSTRTNATWQFTGVRARIGAVNTSIAPTVLSVDMEKDVGIQYDEAQPSPSYLKFGSPSSPATPTSPTPLLRVYGGSGPLADTHKHYIRHPSFLIPRDARTSIRTEEDRDGGDSDFSAGVDPELKAKLVELQAPPQPLGYASREHPSGISGLAPGLQVPASAYLFSTNPPSDNHDKRQSYSPSIPTSETTRDPARFSREF